MLTMQGGMSISSHLCMYLIIGDYFYFLLKKTHYTNGRLVRTDGGQRT